MTSKAQQNLNEPVELRMPSWRELLLFFLMRGFLSVGDRESQRMYKQLVERRRWLSKDQFIRILSLCEFFPGPEALNLAIRVGCLKRKLQGGVLAGLLFLLPGVMLMILLSRLYVAYGRTPQVTAFMFILKPAALGIVTAGAIKLAAEKIRNYLLAAILAASFAALTFSEANLLLVLVAAGSLNLLVSLGLPKLQRRPTQLHLQVISVVVLVLSLVHPHWLRMAWLFFKSGLFGIAGPYASFAFLHQGAVEEYRWVSVGQLLDGLALSVGLPGSLVLFSTFVGYLAGGSTGAVLGTFFVFMPSFVLVLGGSRYVEEVRYTYAIQSFLAGASAAIVGVLIFIIIDVAPVAFVGTATVGVAIATFLAVALLNIEIALVAAVSIVGGLLYAASPLGRSPIGPV